MRRPFFFLETRVIYSPFFNPFPCKLENQLEQPSYSGTDTLKLHMQQSEAEFNFYDWFHRDSDVLELDLRRIETTDIKVCCYLLYKTFFRRNVCTFLWSSRQNL